LSGELPLALERGAPATAAQQSLSAAIRVLVSAQHPSSCFPAFERPTVTQA